MAVPFVTELLGFTKSGKPNTADGSSEQSMEIARGVLEELGIKGMVLGGQPGGARLEHGVRDFLARELGELDASRDWVISMGGKIADFRQYAHLARLNAMVEADPTLRVEIGQDYMISPDVTVGFVPLEAASAPGGSSDPILHAAISCKFSIRSDRVQNIRHESVAMIRHRRGRQPHIVTVTSEPLPSRLAAICRGTGEVDAAYHVCLSELQHVVDAIGNSLQADSLAEAIGQGRLYDLSVLGAHLTV